MRTQDDLLEQMQAQLRRLEDRIIVLERHVKALEQGRIELEAEEMDDA